MCYIKAESHLKIQNITTAYIALLGIENCKWNKIIAKSIQAKIDMHNFNCRLVSYGQLNTSQIKNKGKRFRTFSINIKNLYFLNMKYDLRKSNVMLMLN